MNIRQKCLAFFSAAALCLLFTACSAEVQGLSPYSPAQMAEVVLATQPQQPVLYPLLPQNEDFANRLSTIYHIDAQMVEDGIICYSAGFEAAELTILLLKDEQAAQQAAEALLAYRDERANAFAGYAPDQAALAGQGLVLTRGRWAALLICANSGAEEAFLACFSENPPQLPAVLRLAEADDAGAPEEVPLPEETMPAQEAVEGEYEPEMVLAAWQSGSDAGLSEINREILAACRDVLEQLITEDMTDFEKELAVHDWIIEWADYDWAENSSNPEDLIEPEHDNPYGLLVKQKAICSGYSSTFQLFMDLLGIECITVNGKANADRETHAWNMIRLDGEWYCVDVTWDDPYGSSTTNPKRQYRFFNVTSQHMRDTLHFWNDEAVPEATATAYRYTG